jgi:hypothetical protein
LRSRRSATISWRVCSTTGVGDAALDDAFAAGAILRTHVLRPTWHFVLPEDIRWMLELTAPRVQTLNGHPYRRLALDDGVLEASSDVVANAVRGGNHLTRAELGALLEEAGIATDGQRLPYILMNAELRGLICSGPLHGRQHTYALLDERAPQAKSLGLDEALAELTLRYFTSHGPASPKDFKSWSSLTSADINKGLEMVESQLGHEVIDGVSYWFAGAAPYPKPASPTVHLLQGYDEYLSGYTETRYVLDVSGAAGSLPQDRVVFNGVVILDSQTAGHWRRMLKKHSVIIEAALYTPFDGGQTQALQAAADRYGEFLDLPATVVTTQM